MTQQVKQIVEQIRKGVIDINNQSLFFKILISGLLRALSDTITVRQKAVPHIIMHTGDDIMYLENKGQDFSIEPGQVSNENYVYNIVPRCTLEIGAIDLLSDQLTSPYIYGACQYETEDGVWALAAEFRRMPIKISVDLKYTTDSFSDSMELIQQVISKLAFIRTFNITYLGQAIFCSYKIPENFQSEHLMELEGDTKESKNRSMTVQLEVETSFPVYDNRTIVPADAFPASMGGSIEAYKKDGISQNGYHETVGNYEIG